MANKKWQPNHQPDVVGKLDSSRYSILLDWSSKSAAMSCSKAMRVRNIVRGARSSAMPAPRHGQIACVLAVGLAAHESSSFFYLGEKGFSVQAQEIFSVWIFGKKDLLRPRVPDREFLNKRAFRTPKRTEHAKVAGHWQAWPWCLIHPLSWKTWRVALGDISFTNNFWLVGQGHPLKNMVRQLG